ncbi:LysR family transcriptional regulator [Shinella sp. G-2]|uniref:LysR family transcriptional regulator n=1 Tax=Shinella sp. G-2 TaxID=3133141 RepID=UPI003D00EB64
MTRPDLNLLVTLDVLLAEGSVARAARRLRLSPSAMSRALARLREATGDPLLVRAGRGLVPTPRAAELRGDVGRVLREAEALLRPMEILDLARLERTFTLRNREGFVDTFGPALLARVARDAPRVRLRFVSKPDKESTPLRDGSVDLETGVIGDTTGPEVMTQALFRDRFVGVVREGHPLLDSPMTAERYAAGTHVVVSRRQRDSGPADEALGHLGLARTIAVTVASFSEALTLARGSDLIAQVSERSTARLREGMATFDLPFDLPAYTISMLWHPRMDADPAHRWLRTCLRAVCTGKAGDFPVEQC